MTIAIASPIPSREELLKDNHVLRCALSAHGAEAAKNLEKLHALQANANAWVNTDESLPDDDIVVLVELDDGEVWSGYLDSGIWRYTSAEQISATVTGWQHMPANRNQQKLFEACMSRHGKRKM